MQKSKTSLASVVRGCPDIGMFALDRPIPGSCVHRTSYCNTECFNVKLYRIYPAMAGKDERNEAAWQEMDVESVAGLDKTLERRTSLPTDRFRLMTRGEAFRDGGDIDRVRLLAAGMLDRTIWIPTRAWRDPILRARIVSEIMPLPNVVVLASLDPSNNSGEHADLVSEGWSTMYFGKPGKGWDGPERGFKCPKTYRGLKGHCGICKAGCFAPKTMERRVDVLLKSH
tara:strand:- start:2316 stop:2996 length:681 start_codon:yes stop_codon:yes gene_type:complete